MSAIIISRTISAIVDQRLRLANDQCARLFGIGTTWNSIRIGMRLSIDTQGLDSTIPSINYHTGLCSGTTSGIGSAVPLNFIGNHLNSSLTPASLGYSGGDNTYGVTFVYAYKNVNGVETLGNQITSGGCYYTAAVTTKRWCYVMEFVKGSPNWTVQDVHISNSAAADQSLGTLMLAMEAATMAGVQALIPGSALGNAAVMAFDEVAGPINAVNVGWSMASRPLEISEVLYSRVS